MKLNTKVTYTSVDANLVGVQSRKRCSGMTGEPNKIFGREMYGTFAL